MSRLSAAVTVFAFAALVASFVPSSHAYVDGLVPGESTIYSDYNGTGNLYPANTTGPVFPTQHGPAGVDDLVFQNVLSAEYIVYNFYQQGVEAFTASNFNDQGFKSTTYERIKEISDNEAGHLVIFMDNISPTSLKPGPCKYIFPFQHDVKGYLELHTVIEVVSLAFVTALTLEAKLNASKGTLVAVAEVETRHLTWGLIDVWGVDPFSGPADTFYPYVNQILEITRQFIIPGSCPKENPVYPDPRQGLPQLELPGSALVPGDKITFTYSSSSHVPSFEENRKYYAVFFHGVLKISVPFDVKTSSSVIPKEFENRALY